MNKNKILPKKIFLVRHGRTGRDKNNPLRPITNLGKIGVVKTANEIKKLIDNRPTEIISTPTVRATQTGKIISDILKVDLNNTFKNLRIENITSIGNPDDDLTFIYIGKYKKGELPKDIPNPIVICKRFMEAISNTKSENLIIVGHSGALETFAIFQKEYSLSKPILKELKYSEFIVLERKK